MTKIEGVCLTDAGRAMVYGAGMVDLTFTKAVTGSGAYVPDEDVSAMTDLKEPRQKFGLDSFQLGEECAVSIKFKINNIDLQECYQLSEIGIFAKDGDGEEQLYCIGYAVDGNTEEIPAYDGAVVYYMSVVVDTVLSNHANVSVVYSEEHEWTKEYVDGVLGELFDEGNMEDAFYACYAKSGSGGGAAKMLYTE